MGALYNFTCSKCNYQTEVSGGRDRGLSSGSCTIICYDCKKLFDVTTWEYDENIGEDEYQSLQGSP